MDGKGDFPSNVRPYKSPISHFFQLHFKVGEETMNDGKAFQQLIQRLANVLARALVVYNFLVNVSPCPLVFKEC